MSRSIREGYANRVLAVVCFWVTGTFAGTAGAILLWSPAGFDDRSFLVWSYSLATSVFVALPTSAYSVTLILLPRVPRRQSKTLLCTSAGIGLACAMSMFLLSPRQDSGYLWLVFALLPPAVLAVAAHVVVFRRLRHDHQALPPQDET